MALNFELIKKHPYATGAVVIVGGLIVFYLLSSSSSSASSSSGNDSAALQYDSQIAGINASSTAQANQLQAQLAQSQLEAQVSNTQTAASVNVQNTATEAQLGAGIASIIGGIYQTDAEENAASVQEANQYVYTENVTGMQDAVLEDQINQGTLENANNNATGLAAVLAGDNLQQVLGETTLSDATTLAESQQQQYTNEVNSIIPLAGQQKNSALDATDQTSVFQTILSGGNPGVAAAGTSASLGATVSGNNSNSTNIGTITGGVTGIIKSLGNAIL